MADFSNIYNEIDANVNANGQQKITGPILNETLKDMLQEVDEKKQDTLVAGSGIAINGNVISATGGGSGEEYTAGEGINIDPNNVISVDASDLAGSGLKEDSNGKLAVDPDEFQEKLTAGANIQISGSTISATDTTYSAGQGLELNGTTFSVDYDEVQEKLESGQNIKTVNGNSLLGSGDIVIGGGGGGNYLPLEGGTLQNTAAGEDTELKVIDGMDEDYVKIVAPESANEKPHIEIFENGSGDTKIYYDHIERGSQVSIDLPSSSGTLALTSDLSGKQDTLTAGANIQINGTTISATDTDTTYSAGSGLDLNGTTFSVDTTAIQEKLVAGQNITITGNTISASGGSGQSYVAGNGIDITGNTISVDNTVATTSDLAGYLPLTGGNLQASSIATEVRVKSPSDDSYVYLHAVDSGSPDVKLHRDIQNPTNGEVHEIDIKQDRIDIERWDQSGNTWMADTLYFPEFKTGTIALTSDLSGKQDTLTAGTGISIQNNVISATGGGGGTTYTAGPGIEIDPNQNNQIYVKASGGLGFDSNTDALQVDWSVIPTGTGLVYATDPVDPNYSYLQVDTNTIQEKLVAGSNITITGNTISATGGGSGSGLWVNGTGTNSLLSPEAASSGATAPGDGALNAGHFATNSSNYHSIANGKYSASFGTNNYVWGENATGFGANNSVNGKNAFAVGDTNITAGISSFAGGQNSRASGTASLAFNGQATATKAIAINGAASGIAATGIGATSNAGADNSTAIGYFATTVGNADYSVSLGYGTQTYNEGETALGNYNKVYSSDTYSSPREQSFFTIGNGTASAARSNVLEIKKNNDLYLDGVGGFTGNNSNTAGIKTLQTVLNGKQDQLTAGTGITIQNNVISATGGSGGSSYTAGQGINIDSSDNINVKIEQGVGLDFNTSDELKINPGEVVAPITGFGAVELNIDDPTNPYLDVDYGVLAGSLAGSGLQVDSTDGTTLEIDYSTVAPTLVGNGLQVNSTYGNTLEIDSATVASDLSGYFLPLEGGVLQQTDTDYSQTGLDVCSPDSTAQGYIYSYSEDTSDPRNPIPSSVEIGLAGQTPEGIGKTAGIYLRSNGTIAVDYTVDAHGTTDMVELELPRKASGQTYTIATLDDIQGGGGSYSAGNGINISGSTISVDTRYLDGEYLARTGGTLRADQSSTETLLDVAAPDSTSAISMSADTIDAKLALSADIQDAGISDGDIYRTVFAHNGEIQIDAKTVNPLDPTDIDATHYTLVLPQKNDTIATLSDIQGSGSSYTAGTGIDITNNVISNLAPGLWTSGTGTNSLMTPTAASSSNAIASGNGSISTGSSTKATGQYSFAGGQTSTATGNSTFSYGRGTKTNSEGESALGKYNSSHVYNSASPLNYNTRFSVGNGASTLNTKNSFEIRDDDKVFVYGLGGYLGDANDTTSLSLQEVIDNKQDALTAGSGISIVNNVISATGGSGSSLWESGTGTDSLVAPATITVGLSSDPASGTGAISCGYDTNADGDYSFAQGGASSASGNYSFAASNSTASGDYSASFGASGSSADYAFSAGNGSTAAAESSMALGRGVHTTSGNTGEGALGIYNYSEAGLVFSIGCGTADNARENAVAIDSTGKIFLKGLGGYTGTSTSGCTDLVSFLNNL